MIYISYQFHMFLHQILKHKNTRNDPDSEDPPRKFLHFYTDLIRMDEQLKIKWNKKDVWLISTRI